MAVELRAVAADVAALLEPLDAVVHGGRLEPDECAELGKGRARIALKRVQQRKVELVEVVGDNHIRQIRISCRRLFGDLTIPPHIRSFKASGSARLAQSSRSKKRHSSSKLEHTFV